MMKKYRLTRKEKHRQHLLQTASFELSAFEREEQLKLDHEELLKAVQPQDFRRKRKKI